MNSPTPVEASKQALFMSNYLDTLCLVERLHRLLLDVIKDEFERLDIFDINAAKISAILLRVYLPVMRKA